MKNIKKILENKKLFEWNCWKEEEYGDNIQVVKKLNLDILPNYETKYKGKIYLYMSKNNGSSAWFFITYLIYAFGEKIIRFEKKIFNQTIKFGSINSNQLKLLGYSSTTSGDGNDVQIKIKDIRINCPTEQFISCSVIKKDWNRFWIE
jgi:hypothetical protein